MNLYFNRPHLSHGEDQLRFCPTQANLLNPKFAARIVKTHDGSAVFLLTVFHFYRAFIPRFTLDHYGLLLVYLHTILPGFELDIAENRRLEEINGIRFGARQSGGGPPRLKFSSRC